MKRSIPKTTSTVELTLGINNVKYPRLLIDTPVYLEYNEMNYEMGWKNGFNE